MGVLAILGDILWLLALSIMCGASRMAWGKVRDVLVPVLWSPSGKTLWRAPRAVALASLPTFAFLLSLWLLIESRRPVDLNLGIILLCVRALLASIFAMVHLTQVRRALNQLSAEGPINL